MDTLRWLAEEVVQKLLPDWEVATPDSSEIGNVMKHVIKSCDREQLVIENTNGNNLNVLYEMALLDALGRARIPVKIIGSQENDAGSDEAGLMPFDLAAYRFFEIHKAPERRAETDNTMRAAINAALKIRERGDIYSNPITDFFGVPLSSLSPAYGLARGLCQSRAASSIESSENFRL
jgi:hypothetical protein